jgi:hypothetical protein
MCRSVIGAAYRKARTPAIEQSEPSPTWTVPPVERTMRLLFSLDDVAILVTHCSRLFQSENNVLS